MFWQRSKGRRLGKCKQCASKQAKRWAPYRKQWRAAHRENAVTYGLAYRSTARLQALQHYSGALPHCACCGETTTEFLTIDHIQGGGTAHRKQIGRGGTAMAVYLRKRGYPPGYQILCYNCNCAKAFAKKCPHKTITTVWPSYSDECRRDVSRLLSAGGGLTAYRSNPERNPGPTKGSWAERLERTAETTLDVPHAVACSSGTAALLLAIGALGLRRGSAIVTSPYSFSATPASIALSGLRPVFADIHPRTFTIDLDSVKAVSDADIAAVMPVDLFGRLADYPKLHTLGIPIIGDSCQAVGAWDISANPSGTVAALAQAGAWSFNGSKQVPAGEAGMAFTRDPIHAHTMRLLASHGENWRELTVGLNWRLDEVTACVAYHGVLAVLARNAKRRELAETLSSILASEPKLAMPGPDRITGHALYVYPFVLRQDVDRAAFAKLLRDVGVEISEGYITPPLHEYPAFLEAHRSLPVVEELSRATLCVLTQVRPPSTNKDMIWLAASISAALAGRTPPTRGQMGSAPIADY